MITATTGDVRKRTPFSQRLFWSIFAIFLGFTACFLMFQYQREREFSEEKLNNVLTNYNYQLYRKCLRSQDINGVVSSFMEDIPQKDLRVTIISSTGKVLFDNNGLDGLGNHNDRSEVLKAKMNKEGFAIRSSQSTGKRYFYSASNIDGFIIYLPSIAMFDGALSTEGFSTISFTLYTLSSICFTSSIPYLSVSSFATS